MNETSCVEPCVWVDPVLLVEAVPPLILVPSLDRSQQSPLPTNHRD